MTEPDLLIEGRDPTPWLVAVEPAGDDRMACYQRPPADGGGPGRLVRTEVPFEPFFHLADPDLLAGFDEPLRLERLSGEGDFAWRARFPGLRAYRQAARHALERYNRRHGTPIDSPGSVPDLFIVRDPREQYLTASGRTLFKGLAFEDLARLQLDLETYSSVQGEFSDPDRAGDRIILVSVSDGRGFERLIDGRTLDERAMLEALVALIRERDPDVIEGHNVFNFDLPYLVARCRRHGVPFAIGRDGSAPSVLPSRVRFADRTVDYTRHDVHGRHVVDTWFLVQQYDMVKREMPSYGLKQAARWFGLVPPGRTYVDGREISDLWTRDPDTLARYAMDDVRETAALAATLVGSLFYQTQTLPMGLQSVVSTGMASRIETLLVRAYVNAGASLPRPEPSRAFPGGLTAVYETGVVRRVVKADVESLYPSVMLVYGIKPRRDTLGVFPHLLDTLTQRRLAAKRAAAAAADAVTRARLDALQGAFKILVNSFFGYLGWGFGLFNDFGEAERVTRTGQQVLGRMIDFVREAGGRVVEIDTDGLYFVPPPDLPEGEAAERAFVERMAAAAPDGIRIAFDGRCRAMLSYKVKNYALLDYEGHLKLVGSAFRARDVEPFARAFLETAIRCLLEGDHEALGAAYQELRRRILARELDVREFSRTEYLRESRAEYDRKVARSGRNRAAVYELAKKSRGDFRRGESVTFYMTGRGKRVTGFSHARLTSEFDPARRDENVDYYLRKLDEVAKRLEPFLPEAEWARLFGGGAPKQLSLL